jgi:hypothetical protein
MSGLNPRKYVFWICAFIILPYSTLGSLQSFATEHHGVSPSLMPSDTDLSVSLFGAYYD